MITYDVDVVMSRDESRGLLRWIPVPDVSPTPPGPAVTHQPHTR